MMQLYILSTNDILRMHGIFLITADQYFIDESKTFKDKV